MHSASSGSDGWRLLMRLAATAFIVLAAAACGGSDNAPASESPPASPELASDLNGTYRWMITKDDALASPTEDKSAEHLATFPWVFTMTLEDGTWTLTHTEAGQTLTDATGSPYSISRDRITFTWEGYDLTFTFSVDDEGNLKVRPVEPMDAGDKFVWATHSWTKID